MKALNYLIDRRCFLNLTVTSIVVMLPFIAIIGYVMPATDEYITATFAQTYTFSESLGTLYEHMNARYVSNSLILACGILTNNVFDLVICNQSYIVLAFIFLYFSIFYAIKTLGAGLINRSQALLGALIFLLLYVLNMPVVAKGFYWAPSAVNYQLGHAFFLLFFTFLYSFFKGGKKCTIFLMYLATFALFGANESIAITAWTFLFIVCVYCFWKKLRQYRILIFLFIFGLLCAIPAILSPGSYQYIVAHDLKAPLIHRLLVLLVSMGYWLPQWIFKLSTLFATALLIPFYNQFLDQCPIQLTWKNLIASTGVGLLLILVCLAPQHILLSLPYERVWDVAYFVFLVSWFVTIFVLLGALKTSGKNIQLNKMSYNLLYIGLVLSLLFNHTFLTCVSDLIGAAPAFKKQMIQRYLSIYQQRRFGYQAVVPAFDDPPRTIFFGDAGWDPNSLANIYLGFYFGVKKIYVMPSKSINNLYKMNGLWLRPFYVEPVEKLLPMSLIPSHPPVGYMKVASS